MNDQEWNIMTRLLKLVEDAAERDERTGGIVSPPETGSRTRAAGSKPDDPLTYSDELPFADPAEAMSESWQTKAEELKWEADELEDGDSDAAETVRIEAAVYAECGEQLAKLVATYRAAAQSDSEEVEECHCSKQEQYINNLEKLNHCDVCGGRVARGKRTERSGLHNAHVEASPKTKTP